jgi:hypothetical protein
VPSSFVVWEWNLVVGICLPVCTAPYPIILLSYSTEVGLSIECHHSCVKSALMLHCMIRTGNYVMAKLGNHQVCLETFAVTIQWSVFRQTAASRCEGFPMFQGLSQSLKFQKTFTSWHGCLLKNTSLNLPVYFHGSWDSVGSIF